jgi:hypothetical protein
MDSLEKVDFYHGEYTPETAAFLDRFPSEKDQVVQELFGGELKKVN